ncbi:Pyridine nucleotide-disulfide oxidoreductase [Gracilaria domingensis]|nr:Pyridine nucleotide-disulfide oxidoreductase [Gracilaria domingensis]
MQSGKPAVVIGGGIAGTTCALHLSSLVPQLPIVLIEAQSTLKISSNPIAVSNLVTDVSVQTEQSREWCEQRNITLVQARATKLVAGLVATENGLSQPYSVCCIATGASPFIPPPLQVSEFRDFVLTLRDTHSVQQLAGALSGARTILVIGAGSIAMELVHEISGCHVVWLARNHIGGSFFDKRAADALSGVFDIDESSRTDNVKELNALRTARQAYHERHTSVGGSKARDNSIGSSTAAAVGPQWLRLREGPIVYDKTRVLHNPQNPIPFLHGRHEKKLQILEGCEVVQLHKDMKQEWPVIAQLSNGDFLRCDLIIVATGVTANIEWLKDGPIELELPQEGIDGGVVVRAGIMESSMSGVFAAGDCSCVRPTDGSDWFQLRLWSQALTAGRVAAQNMAARLGYGEAYQGLEFDVFAHATKFFGKRVVLLGRYNAQELGNGFKEYERQGEGYLRVVVKDGRVRGAALVGDVDSAEVFENLILTQLNIDWLGENIVDKETDLEDFFD